MKSSEVDRYIAQYPEVVQLLLQRVRATIAKAAPEAVEAMSYGIPTFKLNGNLVHFAGYKTHIGFYPTPSVIEHFKDELNDYKWANGSIQFSFDKPIPFDLITRMTEYRVLQQSKD
jgi:uncharacterized protein YdhG (YjbR/CyaY superfamily)